MHTRIEMVLTGLDELEGRAIAANVESEIKTLERRFNRFDDRSPLAAINLRAVRETVEVDDDMFMALELCEAFRRGTGGYFDVATDSAIRGERSYGLDAKHHTVRFAHENTHLDMGGFAKGFALERIKRMVSQTQAKSALLNFGNSSVAALGHHPYGEWWAVGVEHTCLRGTLAHEVHLCDSAMSVSGRAENGRYHIVNPITGGTVAGEELILVEGRSALICEVLSTALYAAPRADREHIINKYEGYSATEICCRQGGGVELRQIKSEEIP